MGVFLFLRGKTHARSLVLQETVNKRFKKIFRIIFIAVSLLLAAFIFKR